MRDYLWVCLGAIGGASLRFFLGQAIGRKYSPVFPLSTLLINVTGSFIIGFFLIWTTERVIADPRWRLIVAVGFCGSYTTFSSYAFESIALLRSSLWPAFVANVVLSNALCLVAIVAGAMAARAL